MQRIKTFIVLVFVVLPLCAQVEDDAFVKGKILYEDYLYEDAVDYLKLAADKGNAEACYFLGEIYSNHHFFFRTDSIAKTYYRKGAEYESGISMVKWAHVLYEENKRQEALNYLNLAKTKNIGEAYLFLAYLTENEKEKLELYKKAWSLNIFLSSCLGNSIFSECRDMMTEDQEKMFYKQKYLCDIDLNPEHGISIFNEVIDYNRKKWLNYMRDELKVINEKIVDDADYIYKAGKKNYNTYNYQNIFLGAYLGNIESLKFFRNLYKHNFYLVFPYAIKVGFDTQYEMDAFNAKINELRSLSKAPEELSPQQNYILGAFLLQDSMAIEHLKTAVKQGNKESLIYLGIKYRNIDPLKSFLYFKKAASNPLIESIAMYEMSKQISFLRDDIIDKRDMEKYATKETYAPVAEEYLNAYRNGILYAAENYMLFEIGKSSNHETFTNKSYRPVLTYEKAAECYFKAEQYQKVIEILDDEMVIKTGKGYTYLGLCYLNGYGVKKNKEHGMTLLLKAATLNDGDAMLALGNYFIKEGEEMSASGNYSKSSNHYENAVHWFRRSAHFGSRKALHNLALCYDRGLGVPKNTSKARVFMKWSSQK